MLAGAAVSGPAHSRRGDAGGDAVVAVESPPMQLRIGQLHLATNLLLAPLAGYTDLAFRLVARSCGGVGLAYTELLSADGVLRGKGKGRELDDAREEDRPLAVQLFGAEASKLVEAARWAEDHGADIVDLNMGCPADTVTRQFGGSQLLCDLGRAVGIATAVKSALRTTPLTCKLRLGWDDQSIVAPALARRLEEAGASAIAVHGRTKEMGYSGTARLEDIAEVVAAVKTIPVIGNGDIRSHEDAQRMLDVTGCAGVMIGRAALSKPWLFRQMDEMLTTGQTGREPTLMEKCELIRRHFELHSQYRGERSAVAEFRQRISWYAKTLHPCRMLKDQVRAINSSADFEQAMADFLNWRSEPAAA